MPSFRCKIKKLRFQGILTEKETERILDALDKTEKPRTDGDLISRDFIKNLGATCIAKRGNTGELVAISSIDYLPSAEKTANKININEYVKVRLTDYGKEIFYHQYDDLNKSYGKEIIKPSYPTVDSDGYTSFQLWCFMNLYGRYIDMGVKNVIEPLEIVFESAEKTTINLKKTTITDGDLISRQSVKDLIRGLTKWGVRSQDGKFENVGLLYDDVMFGIDRLPSAEKIDSFIPQEDVAGILNTVESALKGTNYEVVGYDNTDGFLKVLIDMK